MGRKKKKKRMCRKRGRIVSRMGKLREWRLERGTSERKK